MTHQSEFKVGDRVRHLGMDERGTVTRVNDAVHVTYDRIGKLGSPPRDAPWRGEYDADWFRIHPDLLIKAGA